MLPLLSGVGYIGYLLHQQTLFEVVCIANKRIYDHYFFIHHLRNLVHVIKPLNVVQKKIELV